MAMAFTLHTRGPNHMPAASLAQLNDNILRAQDGDHDALELLTRHIRPLVERQLVRYPLSDEDRLDVLQSTLMQVVRRIGSFRGNANFSTWLFRVTANEALMLMRSHRRHRAHVVMDLDWEELGALPAAQVRPDDSLGGDDTAIQTERDVLVRDAVAQLPDHYREVVTAHYQHDLGLHEIARRLRVSESAVRSRLHRARSRLRALLASSPYGVDGVLEAGFAA
jgi:RNA polymerase sigma-70 factor (ECF subfamily)